MPALRLRLRLRRLRLGAAGSEERRLLERETSTHGEATAGMLRRPDEGRGSAGAKPGAQIPLAGVSVRHLRLLPIKPDVTMYDVCVEFIKTKTASKKTSYA